MADFLTVNSKGAQRLTITPTMTWHPRLQSAHHGVRSTYEMVGWVGRAMCVRERGKLGSWVVTSFRADTSGHEREGVPPAQPLVDAVVRRANQRHEIPFHVPGHKRGSRLDAAQVNLLDGASWQRDLTELSGLDNLQKPEGAIREAMNLASRLWDCDHTWFLVNGATVGIHAAIMATCPNPDDCIIVARNAHQSALNGVLLAGCHVVYAKPVCEDGFAHHVTVEALEAAFRRADQEPGVTVRAVLVVSPTYYGVQSDLVGLKAVCDRYGAVLIVDEAHGAHLDFLRRGLDAAKSKGHSALGAGAQLVIQSTHKQLGALTQSSMLHAQGIDDVEGLKQRIDRVLRILQSSSPSYLLMASLDAARAAMERGGAAYVMEPHTAALRIREYFRSFDGGRVVCAGCGMMIRLLDVRGSYAMDPWRLTIVIEGIHSDDLVDQCVRRPTGWSIASLLESKRGVVAEMATNNAVVFACSIGTTVAHADGLIDAIKWLASYVDVEGALTYVAEGDLQDDIDINLQSMATRPRDAFVVQPVAVPLALAADRTAAETITLYPPGIPIVCIGDTLTADVLSALEHCASTASAVITGATDPSLATIMVSTV